MAVWTRCAVAMAATGLVLCAPAVAQAAPGGVDGGESAAVAAEAAPAVPAALTVSRGEMIKRATTWHPHTAERVRYDQNKTHNGYRTDCSGYVSMAAGLAKPGPNTVALAGSKVSVPINKNDMKMGDLFIDAIGDHNTRHVVIFEKWSNAQHTKYWAYEQRGGYGTDHRELTYGLDAGSQFKAHRLKNITG
ncbi:hypothetical protein ACFWY9_36510 [Amycolatopsis sp. NPDC059027]|uniref:hypothetical protein n=1 Tax=Amycolatopsis sp. NPDC059027 TaxID=3346709 RepID=UPI00366B3CFE